MKKEETTYCYKGEKVGLEDNMTFKKKGKFTTSALREHDSKLILKEEISWANVTIIILQSDSLKVHLNKNLSLKDLKIN